MDDVRVRDPASRDQDAQAFRRGRFAERVRREWNPIQDAAIVAARRDGGYDLDVLAQAVHTRVGGDLAPIRSRLAEFAALEATGAPAATDPLVRPGAN
ncbi:MAG: hypothetical protein ABR562_04230 [Thermoplasmatota archaeon]